MAPKKRTSVIAGAIAALALLAVAAIGSAQQSTPLKTLLVDVDHRDTVSLDGPWHYLVDPPPAKGLYSNAGAVRNDGYALNSHPNISTGPHNEEYDFSTAPTMHLPGDWNTQDPTLFRYEGVVWFQRDFDWQPQAGKRTFLHIGAANYRSFVWVNGKHLCDHEGGFTPFDCEATSLLTPGKNFVVIAVDSTRHIDDIPTLSYDWFNYGGVTRDISLVRVPSAFVDDYDVHLQHGTTFSASAPKMLEGYVHVEDAPAGTQVRVRIPEAATEVSARTDRDGKASFQVTASSLQLWSPAQPKLYDVEISSGADTLHDRIGFRDVRVSGTKIMLNGEPIFLQGANMHAEAPVRGGRANTDVDVKNIFSMLHDLHANFVRLAHYPHDERMEREADRDGILIWSEIPLWQRISFDKPAVYEKAVAQLHEMVRRDRNKASVIFWSVSNETPRNEVRTRFLTDLANEARRLDPTRMVTSALIGPKVDGTVVVQNDPLADALDVVGQNEYIGWYEGRPEDADAKIWQLPNKPVLITEFGAEAKYGNHGGPKDRWAEEQQANVFNHQFVMFRSIPQLRGVVPWVLMDFRSPTRNIPGLQDGYNRKGLFSERMEKKQAFSVVEKAYKEHSIGKAE